MKIVGDPRKKLHSYGTKSRSILGHYRGSDLAREFGGDLEDSGGLSSGR